MVYFIVVTDVKSEAKLRLNLNLMEGYGADDDHTKVIMTASLNNSCYGVKETVEEIDAMVLSVNNDAMRRNGGLQ